MHDRLSLALEALRPKALSRRGVIAGLTAGLTAFGLAGASAPAAAEIAEHEQALYDAALAAGETQITWYTAQTGGETAQAIGAAFEARYPGLRVNVSRTTAQVAYQRLTQELMANSLQVDVLSSTVTSHYNALKEQGALMAYRPVNSEAYFEDFRNLADPDDMFHITSAGLTVITYNTDLVAPEDVPTSWLDLLDPKWANQVSVGHPGFSGYVGYWVLMMDQLFGWEYFEKLAEGDPQIGRSINDTITMLNARERSVAAGATGTTLISASRGNPLGLAYPKEGAVLMTTPSAIMAGTSAPNTAKLFMEFLTGQEYGTIMSQDFTEALRPDVEPPVGAKPLSEVILLQPTDVDDGIPRVIELWRDTFGI